VTVVLPDAMPDIRAFLRSHPDISPYTGGRVFFRIPDPGKEGGFPLLSLHRLGGGITARGGDAITADIAVAISVWHNDRRGYNSVRQCATAIESALWQINSTLLNPAGQTVALSAQVTNTIDLPDPESSWPRIVLDATFTVRAIGIGNAGGVTGGTVTVDGGSA
jgi:hypothetical protein